MTLGRDEEPCRVTPRPRRSPRPLLFALAQALLPFSLILLLPLSGQILDCASSRSLAGGVSWPWVGPVGTGLVHVYTDEWEILRGARQPGTRFLLHLGCCPESLGFVTE